jgi:hypothetical protein
MFWLTIIFGAATVLGIILSWLYVPSLVAIFGPIPPVAIERQSPAPPLVLEKQYPRARHDSPLSAELGIVFHGWDLLNFTMTAQSGVPVQQPRYFSEVINFSNPFPRIPNLPANVPDWNFPVPSNNNLANDYIRPKTADSVTGVDARSFAVLGNGDSTRVQPGDRLCGVLAATCLNCKSELGYYFCWEVGKGGWYAQTKKTNVPLPLVPRRRLTDEEFDQFQNRLSPKEERLAIPSARP